MRSIFLTKSLLAVTLGCAVLSACGTQRPAATAGHARSTAAASPAGRPDASTGDPETRFLDLIALVTHTCATDAPKDKSAGTNTPADKGGSKAPQPEDIPGAEDSQTPRYGPGQTPPGVRDDQGDIAVPLSSDVPTPPAPTTSTRPGAPREVPLTGFETCAGTEHARRITEAFQNTPADSYAAVRARLKGLDYPGSRIHRMPEHAGAPRARLDLRFMGGHLALEVTGTGTDSTGAGTSSVTVESFGAPETEDVQVTDVERKPQPSGRT
ncbi:hypothetical protein ACH4S8_31430 [Streptomyces sp. NPDC021080]|uniref:hypothetical protein n=1 Tax=Streptomyces sp. NPDC021080 TaxID=3365110 RepID=UPI0037B7768C